MTAVSKETKTVPEHDRWVAHSPLSNLGRHGTDLDGMPSEIETLNGIVQGLLIHCDWLGAYGLTGLGAQPSRETLPLASRFDDVLRRDGSPLWVPRPPERRSIGTCRDFALMLCGLLRQRGVPARLRCGFAAYLGDGWEDHWVCEWWDRKSRTWHLSDPQIDAALRLGGRIDFDTTDVPGRCFRAAGQVWSECRAGRSDFGHFGHGATTGPWFVGVNVVRDHLAVNGHETSTWDRWREAWQAERHIGARNATWLDGLAADPARKAVDAVPDWLARAGGVATAH